MTPSLDLWVDSGKPEEPEQRLRRGTVRQDADVAVDRGRSGRGDSRPWVSADVASIFESTQRVPEPTPGRERERERDVVTRNPRNIVRCQNKRFAFSSFAFFSFDFFLLF